VVLNHLRLKVANIEWCCSGQVIRQKIIVIASGNNAGKTKRRFRRVEKEEYTSHVRKEHNMGLNGCRTF